MKIAIFGTGYVGLVTGTCFADLGNTVICVDIDKEKIKAVKKGKMPFFEPGLKDLVMRNYKGKRLFFTLNSKQAIHDADVIFVCVGTPPKANGEADLQYVFNVAKEIGENINGYKVIVDKSTVPVGTADKVARIIKKHNNDKHPFDVASNPEFLREGAAVKDFRVPDRVVIGTESERAQKLLSQLYSPVVRADKPLVVTKVKTAELIKYASNAMLATRISFMNELSHLCEATGADIKEVSRGMGLDSRIGPRFLQAGAGYGGSCFPKDVKALAQTMEHYNLSSNILRAVDYVNERQKRSLLPKLKAFLPNLEGKKIALWGISFKPKTSDIRESAALVIYEQLKAEYADVYAFDPEAMPEAAKYVKGLKLGKDQYSILKNADALILVTEWDQFREPDFNLMKKLMKKHVIIDGRNIYNPKVIKDNGFEYQSIGR